MKSSQIPNDPNNIKHTLVIGYKNNRSILRDALTVFKGISGTQKIGTLDQEEIEVIHTFFMGLVPEKIKTNPLYRIKNNQGQSETQIVYN
jgi:hypothetical protein